MASPGTFWSPTGTPPWISASRNNHKRQRLTPACTQQLGILPGRRSEGLTPGPSSKSTTPITENQSSFPTYKGASSRSVEQMARDASLHHQVLANIVETQKGFASVHEQLNVKWAGSANRRIQAPPPTEVLKLIRQESASGNDVATLLDWVSRARAAHSIRDTSHTTYASHLRTIAAVCDVLREAIVPASLQTVRRYTAICNNAVTLRGHLAAWKMLHVIMARPWAGDRDPFIRAAHAGIVRLQPAKAIRMAIRKELTLRIVDYCFSSPGGNLILFGIMTSLAYLFALRVPSELLKQFACSLIKQNGKTFVYGPIHRKNSTLLTSLQRRCTCTTRYIKMCPHYWLPSLLELVGVGGQNRKVFSNWSTATFNVKLREILVQIGIPSTEASRYSSHDFRRGCAKDILSEAGPAAMMGHCGWKSKTSAFHYVSRDEVDEAIVAAFMVDASDDDT